MRSTVVPRRIAGLALAAVLSLGVATAGVTSALADPVEADPPVVAEADEPADDVLSPEAGDEAKGPSAAPDAEAPGQDADDVGESSQDGTGQPAAPAATEDPATAVGEVEPATVEGSVENAPLASAARSDVPLGTDAGDLVGSRLVPTISEVILNSDGAEMYKTTIAILEKQPEPDDTYAYLTGQSSSYFIAISNQDNDIMRNVVRVYFAYDGADQQMGAFPAGKTYNLVNTSTGSTYPMKVIETDVPNVFYYEITGILPGETLGFNNSVDYASPNTPGGTLRIWTESLTVEEAAATEGTVIAPDGDYIQIDWDTFPTIYGINKANSGVRENSSGSAALLTASVQATPEGEGVVRNLAWTISESTVSGTHSTSEGLDYVLKGTYEDVIDLPDELYWRPEVLDVIENGPKLTSNADINDATKDGWWTTNKSVLCNSTGTVSHMVLCVRSGGVTYDVCYIRKTSSSNSSGITGFTPSIVTEGGEKKLKLSWYLTNSSSASGQSRSAEYGTQGFYLRVGDNVVLADLDAINDLYEADPSSLSSLIKIDNSVEVTRDYSYSPDRTASSTAQRVAEVKTGWNVDKVWQNAPYGYRYPYGGTNEYSIVRINNTGILSIRQWGKLVEGSEGETDGVILTDSLDTSFFITPENIVAMLNETKAIGAGQNSQNVPLGDWLTITITNATLCTPGAYQPSDGVDQSGKYAVNASVQATADQSARVFEGATITITKNAEGKVEVTLSGDTTEANNTTYVVDDAAGLEALFTRLGYFPTHNTRYAVTYQTDDTFVLKPGQELDITLRTTCKTTPMMLTTDSESYYPSQYVTVGNIATVNANVAGQYLSSQLNVNHGYYHQWQRELFLYKVGYLQGSSSALNYGNSNPPKVPEGSVLEVEVYGYNYGSLEYDHMQFADHMNGCQVLLVPKDLNPGLASYGLEVYSTGGHDYYLLNKPGTYTDVIVGATSRNNLTSYNETYKAETITVELNGSGITGSLDTVFKWEPIEDWGVTKGTSGNQTQMWYRVLVSAWKAGLVDSVEAEAGQEYQMRNRAWMGDHQGHRLYDTCGARYEVFEHNKSIVDPEDGKADGTDTTENGGLVTESRVVHGETVTYQLEVHNITDVPVLITGDMMRDRLPYAYEVFDWTKGEGPCTVSSIRYYAPEGSTITAGSTSIDINGGVDTAGWYVRKTTSGSGSSAQTVHDIMWNSDFRVSLAAEGTLKILVELNFPDRPEEGASLWDQYVSATKGNYLYNYFYFNSVPISVRHTLEAEGRPVLYKGVYDTGLTTHPGTTSDTDYGTYSSNKSRVYYVNGGGGTPNKSDADLKAETITYYAVLYNGSYDRLYLSDLQDQLPRGFTFNSFCNNSNGVTVVNEWSFSSSNTRSNFTSKSSTSYSYNPVGWAGNVFADSSSYTLYQTLTEGTGSGSPLVTMSNAASDADNNTIKYVNAKVTVTPTFNTEDGRQHLTFTISRATSNPRNSSQPCVHYDAKVGKYYLNPGEAIRFGYNCLVSKYSDTDDLATNTIAMPYYDYYGIGFDLHVPDEEDGGATQTVRAMNGITNNDGGCELMTDEAVADQYHMSVDDYQDAEYQTKEEGNWLVSDVTVERAPVTPGLDKSIGGITAANQFPTASTIQGSTGDSTSLNGSYNTQFGTAYSGAAKSSDIINWRLRVYNEARAGENTNDNIPGMLTDYKVVDTMALPYAFTGRVFYNMYRENGSRTTYSTQWLFAIASRTEGEASVRIAAGTSPTNNNGRNVSIGSAEDDSDDDWFQFGTGSKEGYVKIERNADGEEVMTVRFVGASYAIPGGCYLQLAVHTQFVLDQVIISDLKYNDAVLYPEQGYDAERVAQGKARTKQAYDSQGQLVEENDGIQDGASIVLNQGFTTSSWKKITQIGNASNTARSDESDNYISLDEKCDTFRYDLYVIGPESVMAKIVIIDDLPQEGDHSAFVTADKRNSDFSVGFLAENPEITVSIAPKQGGTETVLTSNYRLYVSTKTEFDAADWRGAGSGWTEITGLEGEELAAALEGARSIRVIIEDPEGYVQKSQSSYLMVKQCQVHVGFNARVDDPTAKANEYAWNSFGYRYTVPLTFLGTEERSANVELEAQPLNVGVRYPAGPSLEKRLVALEQKMEPKTEEVEVITEVPVLNDDGTPMLDEDGNPVTTEVKTIEARVVTEPVERPVYDTTTGEQIFNEDGTPMTQLVDEPVMLPVYDEDGNAVMELKDHPATEDLTFNFIIYEGDNIPALDDALGMSVADIVATIEDAGRAYVYVPLTVEEGEVSAKVNLQAIDYRSTYDPETGEFSTVEDGGANWHWRNLGNYTVVELPMGDYFYTLYTIRAGAATYEQNNAPFVNGNTRVVAVVATNEWKPEYVDVNVKKAWDDASNQDGVRPESVTVRLLADGEEVDSAELSADNDWSTSFEHLLKYHENGDKVQYQVTEDAVSGYSVSYEMTEVEEEVSYVVDDQTTGDGSAEDDADGSGASEVPADGEGDETGDEPEVESETTVVAYDFTVTNTHTPGQTSVTATKVWDDGDDADGFRPDSVTIRLLADGKDTGQRLTLTAEDNWQGSFTALDERKNGRAIEYTVTEDEVPGYVSAVAGDASSGYVVANSHMVTPPAPPAGGRSHVSPRTHDDTPYGTIGLLLGASVVSVGMGVMMRRRRRA